MWNKHTFRTYIFLYYKLTELTLKKGNEAEHLIVKIDRPDPSQAWYLAWSIHWIEVLNCQSWEYIRPELILWDCMELRYVRAEMGVCQWYVHNIQRIKHINAKGQYLKRIREYTEVADILLPFVLSRMTKITLGNPTYRYLDLEKGKK